MRTEGKCRNREAGKEKKLNSVFSRAKLEHVEEEDMAEQI